MKLKFRETVTDLGRTPTLAYNAITGNSARLLDLWDEAWCLANYRLYEQLPTNWIAYPGWYLGKETVEYGVGRGNENFCDHKKSGYFNYPYLYVQKGYKTYPVFVYYWRTPLNYNLSRTIRNRVVDVLYSSKPYIDDGFKARAYWSMLPRFKGQTEVLNFLFELKDFRDMLGVFNTMPITKLVQWVRRKLRRCLDPSLPLSAAILSNEFAAKPLLRDIAAWGAQLATASYDAYKKFQQDGMAWNSSHYTEPLITDSAQLINRPPNASGYDYIFADGYYTQKRNTATLKYKYFSGDLSLNMIFAKYWGLTGTAEALWNMLPFSFLADYVLTIGKSLRFMSSDSNVDITETKFLLSQKAQSTYGLAFGTDVRNSRVAVNGRFYGPNRSPVPISGFRATRYTRWVSDIYAGPALPQLKLPNSAQRRNVAALLRCLLQ